MTKTYRAALVGCSRMGAFIDNEGHKTVPFSHAACYEACPRTELVACVDLRPEALERAGERYGVAPEHRYTDYAEMLAKEQPEIISVATQPEQRTEIVLAAIESGARAIYAEKAMAASMAEADAIVETVEENEVAFNLGTNRRWERNFATVIDFIQSGDYGPLKSILFHSLSSMFNMASHAFDLMLRLNDETPAVRVQARLEEAGDLFDGERLIKDPLGQGTVDFANGVTGYGLITGLGWGIDVICEGAVLRTEPAWEIQTRNGATPIPVVDNFSSGVAIVEDLVQALDSGDPSSTLGGVRTARAGTEMIFAFIESHLQGGRFVELPLTGNSTKLERPFDPRQPKYQKA